MSDGTDGTAACNTISRPPHTKHRAYTLTINNPTEAEVELIDQLFDDNNVMDLIGQHERGENGTLHIQLLINWKNPRWFNGVKKLFPRAHIESVKNLIGTAKYCAKEDTRVEDMPSWEKIGSKTLQKVWNLEHLGLTHKHKLECEDCEDPLEGLDLKWWQEEILDLYEKKPDRRKIYWYWSEHGGVGKSDMAEYMWSVYDDVIVITGSSRDSKFIVKNWCEKRKWKKSPRMIIYDIARCQDSEKISYQAIEDMKNGLKVSTKYESCEYRTARPHVVVFANTPPDKSKMSEDRWRIKNIDDQELPWRTEEEIREILGYE